MEFSRMDVEATSGDRNERKDEKEMELDDESAEAGWVEEEVDDVEEGGRGRFGAV